MMLKRCLLFLGSLYFLSVQYAWPVDVTNKPALQRGAKLYMNYCSGCHSLKYLRYNRMAEDLGLVDFDGRVDEPLLKNNLIFTQASISDPIHIALAPEDAKQWFGAVPPDLSLIARAKGTAWLYTYLKSFYSDSSRPFGTNNLLVPDVAMPNILEPLMGEMNLIGRKGDSAHLLLVKDGELSATQKDILLHDLVTFLAYVGEPVQVLRYHIGLIVIAFLLLFLCSVVALYKCYWRKIA